MNLLYQNAAAMQANAVLTSPWFSIGAAIGSNPVAVASGVSVRVSLYSDQSGLLVLQQTDDPGLQDATFECARRGVSGGNAAVIEYGVTAQYWRFVYANGPVAQTVLGVNAFSGSDLMPSVLYELRRMNLQILAMRGETDNSKDDFGQL